MKYLTCVDCGEQERISHKLYGDFYIHTCIVCDCIDIVEEEKVTRK